MKENKSRDDIIFNTHYLKVQYFDFENCSRQQSKININKDSYIFYYQVYKH